MAIEFDGWEPDYFCIMCNRKIQNYDDGVWVTEIDEETGEEDEENEEVYCNDCHGSKFGWNPP